MRSATARAGDASTDAESFKDLMCAFPSGVSVVTTRDQDETPRGLTCSALCSVSVEPPTLLVCVANHSGTLAAMLSQGVFAINFLHGGGRGAARLFSTAGPDRFSRIAWRPSRTWNLPHLHEDAHALAECRVGRTFVTGDHTVVLGHVAAIERRPAPPLLYGLRRYARWPLGEARRAGRENAAEDLPAVQEADHG
jgi:flavin reductase (DIM6/NTAB) family NADH-FMN oxidoreductase RutF